MTSRVEPGSAVDASAHELLVVLPRGVDKQRHVEMRENARSVTLSHSLPLKSLKRPLSSPEKNSDLHPRSQKTIEAAPQAKFVCLCISQLHAVAN